MQTWSLTNGKTRTRQINPSLPHFPIFHMLFTKQQAKHSFIKPTGKSLWQLLTDIIKFSLQEWKMIHMHTLTHILTLIGVQTVCTRNTARHCVPKLKGGQLNQRRLRGPVWDFLSLSKRARPVLPVFGYIKNTRFWRWMWRWISTSLLCDGLFLAEQILEWRVYYYVHAAHKQLH